LASLFIDSTYDITLGILDDDLGWVKFDKFFGQKASAIIQSETYNLLESANLKISNISSLISIAGPGFYTGLRLSEGFADVLIFSGIKHYSFLSYSIPKLAGVATGVWMTKAYRGEYFFHFWDDDSSRNELVSAKGLEEFLKSVDKSHFYIHSDSSIDDYSRNLLGKCLTTHDLLKTHSQKILGSIVSTQSKVDSFYFRAPEDEFKVSV
jgi:tRNA threonylcarbamoyladenosine biosynthesis protein TsaB